MFCLLQQPISVDVCMHWYGLKFYSKLILEELNFLCAFYAVFGKVFEILGNSNFFICFWLVNSAFWPTNWAMMSSAQLYCVRLIMAIYFPTNLIKHSTLAAH